jgi:hypothetical protein
MIFLESRFDLVRNCLQVWLGRSRANDKEIGERRDAAKIDHDDFLGLFVRGQLGAGRS